MEELKKKKIGDPLIIYIGNDSRKVELGGVGRWFIAELLTGLVNSNSGSSSRGIRQIGVIFPKEKEPERVFEFEHTLDLCKDEDGKFTEMRWCGPGAECYDKRHVQYVPITSIRQSPEGVDHSQWFVQDQGTSREWISSRTRNRRREMEEKGNGQKVNSPYCHCSPRTLATCADRTGLLGQEVHERPHSSRTVELLGLLLEARDQ